jgi:hypothetical protein
MLIACALALFAISILLESRQEETVVGAGVGAGVYSTSALGYAGIYDVMKRLDLPVLSNTGSVMSAAGSGGTVIIAEPDFSYLSGIGDTISGAHRALVILPKWSWERDEYRTSWLSSVNPLPISAPQLTLSYVAPRAGTLLRKEWPDIWPVNEIGVTPSGTGVVQLIRPEAMRAIVGGDDGVLLGEVERSGVKLWVLSDPDIISNHGAGIGDNASFILEMIDSLRFYDNKDPKAPIVFDETIHGFKMSEESPINIMFRFPMWIVTLMTVLAGGIMVYAGSGRFGAPVPEVREMDFGKSILIENSARLLDYGGHHSYVLKRYVTMTLREAARALRAPDGMDEPALVIWLDRVGHARGVNMSVASILEAIHYGERHGEKKLTMLYEAVRNVHSWKGEILNGSSVHSRHR